MKTNSWLWQKGCLGFGTDRYNRIVEIISGEVFMEQIIYITDEERERCRRVVDAFAEMYDWTDVVVVDAGRYGFVKLQYYRETEGFEIVMTFTDSRKLFDSLWLDWFEEQILDIVLGTPLEDLGYEEVFGLLPREMQEELTGKKAYFEGKVSFG